MRYLDRIGALRDSLRADPRIEIYADLRTEPSGTSDEALAALEGELGAPLPPDVRALFASVGTLDLAWRTWGEPAARGHIHLSAPVKEKSLWSFGGFQLDAKKGRFVVAGPYAAPDEGRPRRASKPVGASFDEAMERLLSARGFVGWAQALHGQWMGAEPWKFGADFFADGEVPPPLGLLQGALPALFPDFELGRFGDAAVIPPVSAPTHLPGPSLDDAGAGRSYRSRLERRLGIVGTIESVRVFDVALGDGASEDEIAGVHAAIGYELDPRVLDYFRSVNGFRFSFVRGVKRDKAMTDAQLRKQLESIFAKNQGMAGMVVVPPLRDIFTREPRSPYDGHPDLRLLADMEPGDGGIPYRSVAVELDRSVPDPVVRLTDDHAAATRDRSPVLLRSWLEWLLPSLSYMREYDALFTNHGFGGAHRVRRASAADIAALPGYFDQHPSGTPKIDYSTWE